MAYESKKVTSEDQKELLDIALKNLKAAVALSRLGSEFALDGAIDVALENLQLTVDRYIP